MSYSNTAPRYWLFIFLFIPAFSLAQVKVSGQVLNMADTKPVQFASVFLSNSTTGAETANDGTFSLYNVKPGRYDLIVSIMGYETYSQTILVTNKDIQLPPISLISSSIPLHAVKIKPDNRWYRLYQDFKYEFLGHFDYAKQCKIMDPDSLDLNYDPDTRQLTAKSRGFLIIENKALGYRIKYLLERFVNDYQEKTLVYKGYTIFEDLPGTPAEQQVWAKNRLDCYMGSSMHFYRSVIKGELDTEYNKKNATGFQVYKVVKRLNPGYHESGNFNDGLSNADFKYNIRFSDTVLGRSDFFRQTSVKGIYAIVYPYELYIIYRNKLDYGRAPVYKQFNMVNWQTTLAELSQPYALFDSNGVLTDPLSLVYEGYWATCRVSELLPVDYEPPRQSEDLRTGK
jgi:CarboxypepD_reg-like domain